MLDPAAAADTLAALIEQARRAGADAADAVYVGDRSTSVGVRLGALEDVSRAEGQEIGLRLFVGQRNAAVASSDLSRNSLAALVERAVAMAREAPEDPFAGLAPAELLMTRRRAPTSTSTTAAIPTRPRSARAPRPPRTPREASPASPIRTAEAPRRAPRPLRSPPATASSARPAPPAIAARRASSRGAARTCSATMAGIRRAISPTSRTAAAIGRRAGERAAARLDPVRVKAGPMAILFDPRVATTLLGHFVAAISGGAITRQSSFLLDALGSQVFAKGVTIHDDPLRPRGLRSRALRWRRAAGGGVGPRRRRRADELARRQRRGAPARHRADRPCRARRVGRPRRGAVQSLHAARRAQPRGR